MPRHLRRTHRQPNLHVQSTRLQPPPERQSLFRDPSQSRHYHRQLSTSQHQHQILASIHPNHYPTHTRISPHHQLNRHTLQWRRLFQTPAGNHPEKNVRPTTIQDALLPSPRFRSRQSLYKPLFNGTQLAKQLPDRHRTKQTQSSAVTHPNLCC